MSFYNSEILEKLECPVCTVYMYPPIRQCEAGHSMCDRCFNKVINCPICEAPRSHIRSLALEALQAQVIFPCRNRKEGCRFIDLGRYMLEHEDMCPYGSIPCLFKKSGNCAWWGSVNEFLDHAKQSHANNVFLNSDNAITCNNFIKENFEINTSSFHAVFESDNKVFKCVWDVNYETGLMRWCVFYVGIEGNPKEYNYEIQLENCNEPSKTLLIKATCKHYKQEHDVFNKNLCMFTNYHMLKKFCDDKDLKFKIKILNKFYPRGKTCSNTDS